MGALAQSFMPQTANAAAQGSVGWGSLATGLDAASDVLAGVGALQRSQFEAGLAGQNAEAARRAGQYEESAVKGKYTQLEASQKVAQAANGIDVNSPSAVNVREASANVGAMDAAMVHYNAAREAYGYEEQGKLDKAAGKGALVSGLLKGGASLLGGANSLADKWQTYKTSGAA